MFSGLRLIRVGLLPAAMAVGLLGCGEEPEVVEVEEAEVVAAAPIPSQHLKHFDEIPDHFPDDVTPYAQADLLGVVEDSGRLFVQMSTDDDYQTVMDFYERTLEAEGWSVRRVYDPSDPELGGAVFGEKEGRGATVFVTATDAGALVDIFFEPELE